MYIMCDSARPMTQLATGARRDALPACDRLQREHRLAPQFSDWSRPSIQCAGEVQYLMEVHQVCNQPIMPYWRALWRTALAMIDDTATECLRNLSMCPY